MTRPNLKPFAAHYCLLWHFSTVPYWPLTTVFTPCPSDIISSVSWHSSKRARLFLCQIKSPLRTGTNSYLCFHFQCPTCYLAINRCLLMFNKSKWTFISYKFNMQSLGNIFNITVIAGIYVKSLQIISVFRNKDDFTYTLHIIACFIVWYFNCIFHQRVGWFWRQDIILYYARKCSET